MSLAQLQREVNELKNRKRAEEWQCPLPIPLVQFDKERDLWRGTFPDDTERVYTGAELEPLIAALPPSAWVIRIVHKDASAPEEVRRKYWREPLNSERE